MCYPFIDKLRKIVATNIAEDPATCNEVVLDKAASEYQNWILHPQHFGGPIEFSILSSYYRTQIAAFNMQTTRCDVYYKGKGYKKLVMVIYDGLHYDALAVAQSEGEDEDLDIIWHNPINQTGKMIGCDAML